MGYRIRFATCHGQYRSVHCHRVDRQALNYDKIKMSLYGNTATFFGAADRIRTCGLSGRSSQTAGGKWRFQAIYRHLCTKDAAIQKARGAFETLAPRAFARMVVK